MQFRDGNLEYFTCGTSFSEIMPTFAENLLDWCKSGKK